MAPKTRDMNPSGLGRAIINRKVKDSRKAQESGLFSVDVDSSTRLKSITQERDLDEFLSTAELAGTEFTAERRNVKIIQQSASSSQNPYLLTEQAEKQMLRRHEENKQKLRVPRRPAWTKKMTTSELDRQEKAAFLDWRRGIAELQEKENFLLTPFERNIEVWRQLWRVLERSHLVVQIVDARNPLRFRCEDLESYVHDVEGPEGEAGTGRGKRRSMLLINKSDLLTAEQRRRWADYFDEQGIKYAFYSAANANALQLQRREEEVAAMESNDRPTSDDLSSEDGEEDVNEDELQNTRLDEDVGKETDADSLYSSDEELEGEQTDERTKILSVLELEELLLKMAPDLANFTDASRNAPSRLVVGLVGYPNVGKSSTINSLLGEKKVSVSSTPGKTKHFQTIHLSDYIVLCDCPGLVFPQFATTKAELICDGVLPIDQMREYTGPVSLLVKRIPKEILEATYGISIRVQGIEEGGSGYITAESFLIAYAIARGYMRSGQGNPDEARAARYILKDYVNGKLLFCHSPPGSSELEFNKQTHKIALSRTLGKKKAPVTRVGKDSDTYVAPVVGTTGNIVTNAPVGSKSLAVDDDFFQRDSSLSSRPFIQGGPSNLGYTRNRLYPHQNAVSNDGTPIDGKQAQLSLLVENRGSGKKHHKKMKRVKQRSGKGYD